MLWKIKTFFKNTWIWIKFKKILIALGIISVIVVSQFGAVPHPTVEVNGQIIEFPHSEGIFNGLTISSDKSIYGGWNKATVYVAVENTTNQNQVSNLRLFAEQDDIKLESIQRLAQDVVFDFEVPIFGTFTDSFSYVATSTGETITEFKEVSTQIGIEIATSTRDEWVSLLPNKTNKSINAFNRNWDSSKRAVYTIPANSIEYFKLEISFPNGLKGEGFLFEAVGGSANGLLDPQVDSSWAGRFLITADTASTTGVHSNFPAFYDGSGAPADCTDVMQADGDDIRFTTSTDIGAEILDMEKVSATTTAGSWEYHFRLPTFSSSTNNEVWVWCGNDGAVDISTTATWNSNYKGVWHLDETSGASADSTSNNNDLSDNNSVGTAVGQIGNARDFISGSNQFLNNSSPNVPIGSTTMTHSVWVNVDIYPNGFVFIVGYGSASPRQTFSVGMSNTALGDEFWGVVFADDINGTVKPTLNTWYHVVATYDGNTSGILYVNGVQDATQTFSDVLNVTLSGQGLTVGRSDANNVYIDSQIDETRIYQGELSANWISTEYWMQVDNSTYWSEGAWSPLAVAAVAVPSPIIIWME